MLRYPTDPTTALQTFSARAPVPSIRDTNQWNRVMPEVRAASFFSATVEDARFLDRAKGLIEDHLSEARDKDGILKVGSKAQFVDKMREFMLREGMVPPGEFPGAFGPDALITNLSGADRLGLIFSTNVQQAHGYASWAQGMVPVVLDSWPAARFVRLEFPEEPRPRHVAGEGDVRLKTDFEYWARWQNAAEIGGFEVPWEPYGFNSLMGQEDVDRAGAEALGLIRPGTPAFSEESEEMRLASPEEALQASVKTMDKDIAKELYGRLGAQDDRRVADPDLEAERDARAGEALLYDQLDQLNATGADPGRIAAVEQQIERVARDRESRGTGHIFRVARAAGGLIRFLGDWLFRRG